MSNGTSNMIIILQWCLPWYWVKTHYYQRHLRERVNKFIVKTIFTFNKLQNIETVSILGVVIDQTTQKVAPNVARLHFSIKFPFVYKWCHRQKRRGEGSVKIKIWHDDGGGCLEMTKISPRFQWLCQWQKSKLNEKFLFWILREVWHCQDGCYF